MEGGGGGGGGEGVSFKGDRATCQRRHDDIKSSIMINTVMRELLNVIAVLNYNLVALKGIMNFVQTMTGEVFSPRL